MARSASPKSRTKSGIKSSARARIVSSKVVYRGPVFWITTDRVQEPGGVKVRRDLVHHSGSVVVLAVDDSRSIPRVLLERQYRHAAGDYLWELPAGRVHPRGGGLTTVEGGMIEEKGESGAAWAPNFEFLSRPRIF